ncbi:emb-30, partial [Pristionchus pacificus]
VMPGPRKSSGSGGSRKSTSSPKKKPKMMTSGDENEMIDGSSCSESGSPPSGARRATRSSGGADKTPQSTSLEVKIIKSPQLLHARGASPSGKEYYHSYNMDLMHNKKVYRAPFKVHLMSWNPRMDLLALVSDKGEVCVKRPGWKTTWKLNVNTEERVVHEFPVKNKERKGSPSCLAWSPDGMAVVIGMSTGVYHIIDAEAGMLRFTWSLEEPITKMTWRYLVDRPCSNACCWNGPSRLEAEAAAAMAEVAESTDERVQAAVERAFELETSLLPRSLYQTVLTVITEDMKIIVLLGGVLCVAKIDFCDFMMKKYGVAVLAIADAVIDHKNDHELMVVYSGGAGTVPVRTGTSYGSYKSKRHVGRPGDEILPSSLERHNQMIGIELSVLKLLSDRLWMLAARFVRMSITVFELTEMYEVIQRYWETESTKVVNRFAGCGFSMGEALISQILAGVSSDLMHEWVEQKMGADGALALREFYEKHLVELVENLRSSMLTASSALSNQMSRWEDEAKLLFEEVVDPVQLLLGGEVPTSLSYRTLLPSPDKGRKEESEPFKVDGTVFSFLNRKSMQQLCTVLRQMVTVAEINGYEIAQLSRWLSLLGPILKASKKQVNIVRTCRKFYVPELMRYIVSTFVDEEKRSTFEELLFKLEGMAANEEEIEDEMSTLSLALPSTMEGDAWYDQAKEKKPLPYDVLTRDRYFYRKSMIDKRQKYRDQQQADLDARIRYIQLGMNCPAKRKDPIKAAAQAQRQAAAEAGPALNTRSHRASMAAAVPTGPESGYKRRESRMTPFTANPIAVQNKLRQLAKSYVASKGQYPTMKRTEGQETFEIDKVSHYFRAGAALPESVQRMLKKDDASPFLPLSLHDAMCVCVKSVADVYSSIAVSVRNPFNVRWCNELLSTERDVSLEEGRLDRWGFATDSTTDDAEKEVKLDINTQPMNNALTATVWNSDGIWCRTLFSTKDDTNEAVRQKLQWMWKIQKNGERNLSVRPASLRVLTPISSPRPTVQHRQAMADCTPTMETGQQMGGGMQALTIQMDEDNCITYPDHGEPIEIKKVFPMKSGTTLAIVVFESEQGKRQRLVRLNPYMDYRVFVHEDILRTEIYEQWELCRHREMGAALSEGGTRVTWFELREK